MGLQNSKYKLLLPLSILLAPHSTSILPCSWHSGVQGVQGSFPYSINLCFLVDGEMGWGGDREKGERRRGNNRCSQECRRRYEKCFAHHFTMSFIPIPFFMDTCLGSANYRSALGSLGGSSGFSLIYLSPVLEFLMTPAHLCHLSLSHPLPHFKKFVEIPCLFLSSLHSLCNLAFLTTKIFL